MELKLHYERQVETNVKQGMSRQEAARQARLALGGVNQLKEEYREARGVTFVDYCGLMS